MNPIRNLNFLIAFCAVNAAVVTAGPIEDQFFQANQHYAEAKFEEAVVLYEKSNASGVSSGPLYYNLGNAYFKLGRIGKAILNYERARRLMPQDEDILANLSYVKGLVEQAQPQEDYRLYERAFLVIRNLFSPTGWVILLVAMYTLIFAMWLLALFFRRLRKNALTGSWVFIVLTIASSVFTSARISAHEGAQGGIIVQNVADVRYSPSTTGAVAFQLKEGLQAEIVRTEGEWCYIRLTHDKIGWVEHRAIEAI